MGDRLIALLWRVGNWGYLIVFAGTTLESAAFLGFLIPGETLVLVSGVLASMGVLDVGDLMIVVAIGAIIGDNVSYRLGRSLGHPWLVRYGTRLGFDRKRLERVESFYERHGGLAVVFGRFVGLLRPLVPFVAGAAHMSYPRFFGYNLLACVLWTVSTVLVGYFVGESWEIVERWLGRTGVVVGAAIAVVVVGVWLFRRSRRRAARSGLHGA